MAITHIVFGSAGDLSKGGVIPALIDDEDMVSQTITPSGSNQVTTISAPVVGNQPVCIVATDTSVFVAIGTGEPDATGATPRHFLPAGAMWGVICAEGAKAAVVAA